MIPVATSRRIAGWAIALGIFFIVVSAGKIVTLLTDFLWFKELFLTQVFTTALVSKITLGTVAGIVSLLCISLSLAIAIRQSARAKQYTGFADMQMVELLGRIPWLNGMLFAAGAVVSFLVGSWASNYWEICLKAMHAVPFGVNDPLFGRDIGFYVFQLPFLRFVYHGVLAILFLSFVSAMLVYLVRQNCVFDGRSLHIARQARAHLLVIAGLIVLSLFFFFQFRIFQMAVAQGPLVSGAGYAQIKAGLPLAGAMRFVCIAAALLVWAAIFRKTFRLFIAAIVIVIAGTLAGSLLTQTVQKFVVGPDELSKETPYISWSIANTRAAYGLDNVETRDFVPAGGLGAADLDSNAQTISNIRLWDQAPLLTTYSQLQEIRTYYKFLDVDNDRYTINGLYRQVMLSPRELVSANLPSRGWINECLTYTHGYGLCLGPVTSVTPEGLPDFFIKNIPPESSIPLSVSRPQIYFGEAGAGYVIVNTGAKEFDYPSGNDNVYTVYSGSGGIRIGGLLRKALFALRFQELKILLRPDISADSRIMFNRQILDRVRKAVPFLWYDGDPYMVIRDNGTLAWMIDGYTTSDAYPYSAAAGNRGNYIRNSVKAVVDAYDGSVALYIADKSDPIIRTYDKIFPGVFRPLADMPADLHRHIRYPQTLFGIQARVYSIFHMTDPQVFYNKEDIWRIPDSYGEGASGPMDPYYTVMKLAEVGTKEEFILMVPFCPSKKDNMIAWMAARCDEPDYGKLLVFEFPKQTLVYGPSQIESRVNQDPEISKQLTLWNQGGSRVIRGSLLVIPVDRSLIYVQPLYLTSQAGSSGGGVPELKRVIVAYENSIAMESTLEKSLSVIFGGSLKPRQDQEPERVKAQEPSIRDLISDADRQFTKGQDELKRGNWAGYGEAMKKVEALLREIRAKAGDQ